MGARVLERSGPPLWSQLQDDLVRRIGAGEFAEGSGTTFPGELALTGQYAVSRHTVRQALSQLRADGVVVAERGRPPRLADGPRDQRIEQPVGAASSLFASVEAAGRVQTSVVRRFEKVADGIVATRLALEESTPLLFLERLRLADAEPLAWDRVWLPFAETEALVGVDLTHTGLYPELAARTALRVDGGQERIRAALAAPALAAMLDIAVGDAILDIDRLGCHGGRPVEWRRTQVRADRFTLAATFGDRSGYRFDTDQAVAAG